MDFCLKNLREYAFLPHLTGDDQLKDSLVGADIVVIPAGVPRKPGMTRDDLFNTNASIVAKLAQVGVWVFKVVLVS